MKKISYLCKLKFLQVESNLTTDILRRLRPDLLFALAWLLIGAACSSTRHVPEGGELLDKVKISIDGPKGELTEQEMINYVRQQPNHKMLWSAKLQLGIYNMSGKDSTKWWNRWIRKIGEPPVVFDTTLTALSTEQLRQALINKGYLHAEVRPDTFRTGKRKVGVEYTLLPGEPYTIRSIDYQFPSDSIRDLVMKDSIRFPVRTGDLLDRTRLDSERDVITRYLRNHGYFAFSKDFVTFNADTTAGSSEVDLSVIIKPPYKVQPGSHPLDSHTPYYIGNVTVVTNYQLINGENLTAGATDSVTYKGMTIVNSGRQYLRSSVLYDNCYIQPGHPYRLIDVERTYQALARLGILKFTNITFRPRANIDGTEWLDAYILLTPGKSQTVGFEIEGTNSEGDLGVAASIQYSHRNLGRGSETFTAKFRGAYESLSGDLEGLIHNRYMEYSVDLGLSFPKFKFPFLRESFKRKIRAATEFNLSMNYQERPEYTRVISTVGWSYKWAERGSRTRHTLTPIDVNYVYLPESTNDFIDQIAPDNPLLRYSYEDHFIMRLGYSFYHTNKRRDTPWTRGLQSDVYTIRVNAETAGNLLFAINSIFNHRSDFHADPYKIFGIHYSQYVKMEGDYALVHTFDHRNSLAFHAGLGVGVPYGNSSILPFEKRFYGGGANGVRGWDVRTLGPGSYRGSNSVSDFINQCGDIRLDLSTEYRAKLFWVVEAGIFIDVGNIWTIHNYENQPGGMFKFNKFYKQLAAAYGLGIRLDFSYFLLRFDLGMKAHNPAQGEEPWPLIHPRWGRDRSFHFSIGYPF